MDWTEMRELSCEATKWCKEHHMPYSPLNVIMALRCLGYISGEIVVAESERIKAILCPTCGWTCLAYGDESRFCSQCNTAFNRDGVIDLKESENDERFSL